MQPTEDVEEQPVEVVEEANRPGMAIALAGALLMLIAVFLPRVNGHIFARVEENTLIQSGDGWFFITFALLVATSVYRIYRNPNRGRSAAAVLLVGAIAIGFAVYDGTGERLELSNSNSSGVTEPITERADPGVGIYGAGIGGLLALVGGFWLMGWGYGGKEQGRRFKTCPDCAEKVLADAQICKYCRHRFT